MTGHTPPRGFDSGSIFSQSRRIAPADRTQRKMPVMRTYDISYLDDAGREAFSEVLAPADPIFESAFAAFGPLVPILTTQGPVPVTDLVPGMRLVTADGGTATLTWVGAMMQQPARAGQPRPPMLTRVATDSFGLERPAADIVLGPAARTRVTGALAQEATGHETALVPLRDMHDSGSVVPVTPHHAIRLYHLVLDRHALVLAGGLPVESFHPGPDMLAALHPRLAILFMSLFPHLTRIADFGRPCLPRAPLMRQERHPHVA